MKPPHKLSGEHFLFFLSQHKLLLSSIGIGLGLLLAAVVWQLQPKQPRYIAVVQPTLTTQAMPASQQALIIGTVFDAIKHSVLQLDDYYLIPQDQVADIRGDNEAIRHATGADEIITTDIQCKIDSCSLNFSRLSADNKIANSRLRVNNTKTVDVLTDNFLSVADIVQSNIGQIYSTTFANALEGIDESEYATFLDTHVNYLKNGASKTQLDTLDRLQIKTRSLPALQTLYKDITLDLYFESKNNQYLTQLENNLRLHQGSEKNTTYLYNLFYLQIAKGDFDGALKTTAQLKQLNASHSAIYELYAYSSVAHQDYQAAIGFYKKALESKITFTNLLNIANAYWYAGDTQSAKQYLQQAIALSPQQKAFSLSGLINLTEGNIEAATKAFEKVIESRPDDISNLDNLGLCYLLEKKYPEAIATFEKAAQLSPQNTTMLLNKADALNLAGNLEESYSIYRDIISSLKKEDITNTHLRHLAQAHAHIGNYADALTALQLLEKLDAQNVFTTYTAALVHTLANNNASALLNISNSLNNGMNIIWFNFSWFDSLCKSEQFIQLMNDHHAATRCNQLTKPL